jgi:carbonic anhydrase/acetyltransferase-like protein (isoleucine patch superfamily)
MPLYELDGVAPKLPASGHFWIAPDAALIGDVELLEEASVWFQAVLRGDNERILVGKRSNVQDGSVFHTDPGFPLTVGAGCTNGKPALMHGVKIRDGG